MPNDELRPDPIIPEPLRHHLALLGAQLREAVDTVTTDPELELAFDPAARGMIRDALEDATYRIADAYAIARYAAEENARRAADRRAAIMRDALNHRTN